jgi:citrate lyase subunit beta/citryl-CoA lyase
MNPETRDLLAGVRTLLFVPADRPDRVAKALGSGADAVIVDLEDAVLAARKDAARAALADVLGARAGDAAEPVVLVRVNALDTEHAEADLETVRRLTAVDGVVVPKAEAAGLERIGGDALALVALVETAAGVLDARDIARVPAVAALMLGTIDLGAELAIDVTPDGPELVLARSQLVLAAAAAGLGSPIDGVWPDVGDSEGLRREAEMARRLGFGAKACIHPRQLEVVRATFAPSEDRLAWAARVVAAARAAERDGQGATSVDGQMVDRPVLERARQLLARASHER